MILDSRYLLTSADIRSHISHLLDDAGLSSEELIDTIANYAEYPYRKICTLLNYELDFGAEYENYNESYHCEGIPSAFLDYVVKAAIGMYYQTKKLGMAEIESPFYFSSFSVGSVSRQYSVRSGALSADDLLDSYIKNIPKYYITRYRRLYPERRLKNESVIK